MGIEGLIGIGIGVVGILISIYFGINHVKKNQTNVRNVGNVKAKNGSKVEISNVKIGNIENEKKSGE